MEHKLTLPCNDLTQLKAGDTVLLSGTVYTARDAAHGRMIDLLSQGQTLPIPLEDNGIYYVGPTPHSGNQVIGSAGPTTSGRMDSYAPKLLDLGLKVMIGKGKRSPEVVKAIIRNKAVYLVALGGGGALMAKGIKTVELVCWDDLGCEAVRRLTVENLPLTVGIDCEGNDLYTTGRQAYLNSL